jgi:hypothetical protein
MYDDLPLNHRLRHFYRGLTGLTGVAMLAFGVTGLGGHRLLPGLATNVGLAVVVLVLGVVLVGASVLWRDFSHLVYLAVGGALMVLGLAMLTLLRPDDIFGANMTSCLTVLTVGLVVFLAGTYSRTGTPEEAADKEARRRGGGWPLTATVRPRPSAASSTAKRAPTKAAPRRPTKTTPRRPASAR